MQERRKSLIAIRSIQVPLILQAVLLSFILINLVLIGAFLMPAGLADPMGRLYLGIAIAVVEIVCLAGVLVAARKQSNRIVGPVYRVGELSKRLKGGDLTVRMELREGDYFREQLALLDDAVRELHDRIQGIKQELGEGNRDGSLEAITERINWFQTGDRS